MICDARFAPVREAFEEQLASGNELGGSIAIDLDGQTVLDIWGGEALPGKPWQEDTIVNVWSTTKTVTNLAALVCVDRGLLDPYEKVAQYWPEFAANGKEAIELRHILAHTSGVSGWDPPFTTEEMYDLPWATSRLAGQAPWWEPGSASGYHAHNQGHLVGELIRRVTGKGLRQFVAEDVARGADFQIGAAESDWDRIAPVIPPPPLPIDFSAIPKDSPMFKTFTGPPANAGAANTPAWRRAELGALNGHGNARSVMQVLRALSLGQLSQDTIDVIFDEQIHGTDLVLGVPLRFGIGWALPETETVPYIPQGRVCFWGGWGGSLIITDLDRRATIAYMMNKMAPGVIGSDRSEAYVRAFYACLD